MAEREERYWLPVVPRERARKLKIVNVHERCLPASADRVGQLIDRLASADDRLWPGEPWPPLRFVRPLGVGAAGGHGPIRYFIEVYKPGQYLCCRFTAPKGFRGTHSFEVRGISAHSALLTHALVMDVAGISRIAWPLLQGPLHDALIEMALDRAEAYVAAKAEPTRRLSNRAKWLIRFVRWSFSNRWARRIWH